MKRRNIERDNSGDIPVLAIFAIFSILIAGAALTYIRTTRGQTAETIRTLTAADIARARSSAIQSDLNDTLRTAITSSMWEVGTGGGARDRVEEKVIEKLNKRIENGWRYGTVKENVPNVSENNLHFLWHGDGCVTVYGLLDAEITHVKGPTVFGLELYSNPEIRFQRIKKVAELVMNKSDQASDLDKFENRINENYGAEWVQIGLSMKDNSLIVEVTDVFGGRSVFRP